jgi:hypothetical protein
MAKGFAAVAGKTQKHSQHFNESRFLLSSVCCCIEQGCIAARNRSKQTKSQAVALPRQQGQNDQTHPE